MDANIAYYCLHKFHWEPSKFLALGRRERAFVVAAIKMKLDKEEKERKNMRKRKR